MGRIIPSTRSRIVNVAQRSHMQSSYTVLCQQFAPTKLFLKTEIECCSNDSRLHDLRQKSHSETVGNRSSSSRFARTWHAQGNLCTTGRTEIRDVRGNTTGDQTRSRRLVQDLEPAVEKKDTIWNWSLSRRSIQRCYLTGWKRWLKSMKSSKS